MGRKFSLRFALAVSASVLALAAWSSRAAELVHRVRPDSTEPAAEAGEETQPAGGGDGGDEDAEAEGDEHPDRDPSESHEGDDSHPPVTGDVLEPLAASGRRRSTRINLAGIRSRQGSTPRPSAVPTSIRRTASDSRPIDAA